MRKLLSNPTFQVGFTLIELLIVIVIIVVVIGIGAASYTTVARNSRNSQRQSDLHKIAEALEEYYADHNQYPCNEIPCSGVIKFGSAGHDCTREQLCCLLGGDIAKNIRNTSSKPVCGPPYNQQYINPGDVIGDITATPHTFTGIPKDPYAYPQTISNIYYSPNLWDLEYAFGTDGQSYVISTLLYEGTPPAEHAFSSSFAGSRYWDAAAGPTGWRQTWDWSHQYALKSPTR